jgi:hypothetical protein
MVRRVFTKIVHKDLLPLFFSIHLEQHYDPDINRLGRR